MKKYIHLSILGVLLAAFIGTFFVPKPQLQAVIEDQKYFQIHNVRIWNTSSITEDPKIGFALVETNEGKHVKNLVLPLRNRKEVLPGLWVEYQGDGMIAVFVSSPVPTASPGPTPTLTQ